jgi:adenine-specific DNA-methyltransferase
MTNRLRRLELAWIGKEDRPRLEPRILLEDHELSYAKRVSNEDVFDNCLIHGDNLLALKALEQEFAGKVKCICIDPPYNTGSAFSTYDDGLEHSIWLGLMRDRVERFRDLLSDDGSLWVFLDDNEAHYMKVLCDEVFGRSNFVQTVIWQRKASPANDAKWLSNDHDYILVYAKNKETWRPYRLERNESQNSYYTNPDNDPRGPWNSVTYTCNKSADERPNLYYAIKNPNTGQEIWPKRTAVWRCGQETHAENEANRLLYWGKDGKSASPRLKRFLEKAKPVVPRSVWLHEEVGHTQSAMEESKQLFPGSAFPTPKTEAVIARILQIATREGDVVLDSFLGSGTTAAVAHKLKRRWLGVELSDAAKNYCLPRLKKVIAGDDPGGITEAVGWTGGGGFRFFKLAPSLLEKDKWGNWIVSNQYKPEMLAEAMCKLEGFRYAPDREVFWNHGHSTERDFIYVTTQNLSPDQLRFISEQVGPERTLLICCGAFRGKSDFPNLTVKKIPEAVLARCEWARDDYSLNVTAQAPVVAVEAAKSEASTSNGTKTKAGGRRKKATPVQALPLFAGIDTGSK